VRERGHDRLTAHGSGREFSVEAWRELGRQFIEQKLVDQDLQFGGLRLTARGRELRTSGQVLARVQPAALSTPTDAAELTAQDTALFDRLRKLRRELADQVGMPAYVVFSDRALIEMATRLPRTPEQFLAINGVGDTKLLKYGELFLQTIGDYAAVHAAPQVPASAKPRSDSTRRLAARGRAEQIGEAFAAGETLEALAKRFDIQRQTVLQNLSRFSESGGSVDPPRLLHCSHLPEPERKRVIRAFNQFGLERLGPVHEALGGSVAYEELHLLRLWVRCQRAAR
jgi:ATP-dependent DNA helicase RecQ